MLHRRFTTVFALALLLAAKSPSARGQAPILTDADSRVARLVAAVSEDRLRALGTKLVSFGTRESMSNMSSSSRGIGAARQWIFDELSRSSPRLQVSFDT